MRLPSMKVEAWDAADEGRTHVDLLLEVSRLHGPSMWRQRAHIDAAIRFLRLYGELLDRLIERDAGEAAGQMVRDAKIKATLDTKSGSGGTEET